jgi:tRNA (guanine37-N1)-methyltransferase
MKFDVITIFPEFIDEYAKIGIIARAVSKKLMTIKAHQLRDFALDAHRSVDDRPYGGGAGMVLKPDVMQRAIKKVAGRATKKQRIVVLSPQGKVFTQTHAARLAKYDRIVFISGRYEGFDERILGMADEQLSIGDYVLMGGELPALVAIETIARFIPGVVGKLESTVDESFALSASGKQMLEYPQYTRPEALKIGSRNARVPKILLSGDHGKIEAWRREKSLARTKKQRPDLLA